MAQQALRCRILQETADRKGKARGSARLLDEALEGAAARVAQQALQVPDLARICLPQKG